MATFKGKVYTVTGAASGIGRSTTLRLAELGAAGLAISDINETDLEETKQLCGYTSQTEQVVCTDRHR